MISTSDFKKGTRFEEDGAPWQVMEVSVHNPSARGAATLVKVKARNLVTQQVLQKSYKSGEMFQEPNLTRLKVQYLYDEGDQLVFMDTETFEQFNVPADMFSEVRPWLNEELTLALFNYDGRIISFEMPTSIEVEVSLVEAGAKGDTASGKVMSRAELVNGVELQVPTFIKEGSTIKVDPSTNTYLGRT